MKAISFRAQLKGTLSDFLKKEGMSCQQTEEGLLEIVVALSRYTEEGHALFPQVVVCDDLSTTVGLLQCSDPLKIGTGKREPATLRQALKKCAPLARGGWVVYIHRKADVFDFGVFRAPTSPIALDIKKTLQSLASENQAPPILFASQLAEKVVEIVGAQAGTLHVHLSATPDDAPSPNDAVDEIVYRAATDVEPAEKEQIQSYLHGMLSDSLRQGHGALLGVLPKGADQAAVSQDGIVLETPISLSDLVVAHERNPTADTLAALLAYS